MRSSKLAGVLHARKQKRDAASGVPFLLVHFRPVARIGRAGECGNATS
jgi:hypothetical protein